MDKIKEVMGLLDQYAWEYRASNEEKTSGARFLAASNAAFARKAIESKLRELLEREQLSDEQVAFLKHVHANSAYVGGDFEAGVRYGERAHGIGNESKEM